MSVKHSVYKKPMSARGIERIEKDQMEYFDKSIWQNLNSGTMEQYFNEKTRVAGFHRSKFLWKRVVIGIVIGLFFALINQYVGLKVGTIVSGAWYVSYLLGLAMKWEPTQINMIAGASTGAAATCTGFVFSYPALYLLAMHPDYQLKDGFLISEAMIPPMYVAFVAVVVAGIMGVMYFTIFRRIWLVDDPLPFPSFEASLKLVEISNDLSQGKEDSAQHTIKMVTMSALVVGAFTFLRDFPIMYTGAKDIAGEKVYESFLDSIFGGEYYHRGELTIPYAKYTAVGFELIPIQLAIGWFMRLRTALLVSSGTMFTWFIIIPLAVYMDVPIYVPTQDAFVSISAFDAPAFMAYGRVARVIAIGAILGGGITALLKTYKVFATALGDIKDIFIKNDDKERTDYVEGLGWFEWPMSHVPVSMLITGVAVSSVLIIAGFPVPASIAFSIILVFTSFLLGAIAVKVAGETGTTPVSGTSFIVLLMLIGVFKLVGTDNQTIVIMSVLGATIFGSALSLSSDIIGDFKVGIYAGTRPYHLVKGEITGLIFGSVIAVAGATVLSKGLATVDADGVPLLNLRAPQAHAFATLLQTLLGGQNVDMVMTFLFIGVAIGVLAELTTGMGTAFGLGMYLPLPVTLPLVVGGATRDWWQKNKLEKQAKEEGWDEDQVTMKLVNTYMIAAGVIIGEALVGTIVALWLVIPLITGG